MDVMAMPEQDGWIYTFETKKGPIDGPSYICSAYVTALYKAAGLFEGLEINATEFTPADIVALNFWDETTALPAECLEADPDLPYCQLLGKYRIIHLHYNSIEPYDHMNETCPLNWPTYDRDPGC